MGNQSGLLQLFSKSCCNSTFLWSSFYFPQSIVNENPGEQIKINPHYHSDLIISCWPSLMFRTDLFFKYLPVNLLSVFGFFSSGMVTFSCQVRLSIASMNNFCPSLSLEFVALCKYCQPSSPGARGNIQLQKFPFQVMRTHWLTLWMKRSVLVECWDDSTWKSALKYSKTCREFQVPAEESAFSWDEVFKLIFLTLALFFWGPRGGHGTKVPLLIWIFCCLAAGSKDS